jgi:hypothetical protein
MIKRVAVLLLLLGTSRMWGQERFSGGELKGFTKSSTEGIVTHLEQPFSAREIRGVVFRMVGDKTPLEEVLFELRGPGTSEVIRSARTGADGKFHLGHVPPGKYLFKATALGFQSLVGVVIVSPKALSDQPIKLQMRPAV